MLHASLLALGAALAWPRDPAFTAAEIQDAGERPQIYTLAPEEPRRIWIPAEPRPGRDVDVRFSMPGDPGVALERIVNIGQRVWTIVDANKPVVDIRAEYAAAVPQGITHWEQLQGWEPPVGSVYGFAMDNALGGRVVEVRYQVLRMIGGSYQGRGHYLTGVTVEPLLVRVAWGYKVTITADATTVANADKSGKDPVAGMTVEVRWRVRTPIRDTQGAAVYYLRGDGLFLEINREPEGPHAIRQAAARIKALRLGPPE